MTDILMPQFSDAMQEGTILKWLVSVGQTVAVGDELAEIEADKATMTLESEVAGAISLIGEEGETYPVGEVIARAGTGVEEPPPAPAPAPVPRAAAAERAPQPVSPAPVTGNGRHAPPATPVARRAASLHGVDLGALTGSGPRGRITKDDVLGAARITERAPVVTWSPPSRRRDGDFAALEPPALSPGDEVIPFTRLQHRIAQRMAESKRTVPHFQIETEARMDALLALRAELKAAAADDDATPSVNDFVVKAAGLALRRHPRANACFHPDGFLLRARVNVGIAVAADNALLVPTIFDVDTKSLGAIAVEARAVATRARDGKATAADLEGGTFTVSNLGMFGVTAMSPVINPPQVAILGVGALRPTLARGADGSVEDRTLLTLTLSCDHRILYGADAAAFLADIRALLEQPLRLAL